MTESWLAMLRRCLPTWTASSVPCIYTTLDLVSSMKKLLEHTSASLVEHIFHKKIYFILLHLLFLLMYLLQFVDAN